jgi:hypothetical protein
MSEQNRELVRRLNDEFHNQDRIHEVIAERFAPDFVNHSAPPGLPRPGRETRCSRRRFDKPFRTTRSPSTT